MALPSASINCVSTFNLPGSTKGSCEAYLQPSGYFVVEEGIITFRDVLELVYETEISNAIRLLNLSLLTFVSEHERRVIFAFDDEIQKKGEVLQISQPELVT